jgi:tRNA uridine 5-carboxymethylaminomethyl modification enzyme
VVDSVRWSAFESKRGAIISEQKRLKTIFLGPNTGASGVSEEEVSRVLGKAIEREYSLYELLRRPDMTYGRLMSLPGVEGVAIDATVSDQVEIQAKYSGYIERQKTEVERSAYYEEMCLPQKLDYQSVRGLSTEVQQKLNQHKPETVGQAARISGITPAAISLLLVHLKRGFTEQKEKNKKEREPRIKAG